MKNIILDKDNHGVIPQGMTVPQKRLLAVCSIFFLVFVYIFVKAFFGSTLHLPGIPGGPYGKVVPLALFGFTYFAYTRGFKSASFMTLFALVYCWAIEELSIHTGFPFGHYYYSDALGYKLDVVPVLLGLNYFWVLILPAFFLANLISQGSFLNSGKSWKTLLFTSFVASILIAGIDMAVDPLDATKLSEWVWTKNSYTGYYVIPYSNYLGYIITMTPMFFIYGLVERKFGAKPFGPINRYVAGLALLSYLLTFMLYSLPAPSGVFLVACFTMLFPLILAYDKLNKLFSGQTAGLQEE